MITTVLLPCLIAIGLALTLTPLVRALALRYGYMAKPNAERWHKQPTALLGGVAIGVAFLVPLAVFLPPGAPRWGIFLGALAMGGVGLLDDLRGMSPLAKLLGQTVAASLAVAFGIRLEMIPISMLAIPATLLWILLITNAVNLLDNMDGLAAGITGIASASLLGHALLTGDAVLAVVSASCLGATLGFLRYNFHPASIFMGDSGSLLLGFVLATSAVMGTSQTSSNVVLTLVLPALVLAVPLFDTTFVTFARTLTGRPVSMGGKDHISHRLVFLGLSEKRAVLTLFGISLLFGFLANLGQFFNVFTTMVFSLLVIIALVFFGLFLGEVQTPEGSSSKGNGVSRGGRFFLRRLLEMGVDAALISTAYVMAYLLRFEGTISPHNLRLIEVSLPLLIAVNLATFYYFGLYQRIWRYVGIRDMFNILQAVSLGTVLTILALVFLERFEGYSRAIFILHWMILFLLVSGVRVLVRIYRESFMGMSRSGKRLLIVGAGDGGELLLREIRNNQRLSYVPVGFVDDDNTKKRLKIHGTPVIGTTHDMSQTIVQHGIEEVIIAIPSANDIQLKRVYETCRTLDVPCRRMASIL